MQPIDLKAAKAAPATERRALAILAYDNAKAEPAGANWESVADLLRLALPAAKAAKASAPSDGFAPWADYEIPRSVSSRRLGKSPVLVVTFACGAAIRAPAVSMPGRAVNIGRGLRIAFAFYRARIAREYAGASAIGSDCVNVPPIVSAICEASGAEYNAAECNERTAAARLGGFDQIALAASAEALPAESKDGAMTRREFYRAHYGIAEAQAEIAAGANGPARDGFYQRADYETRADELAARIEDCGLHLGGMSALEVSARRRSINDAAVKAAKAAAKAERNAAHTAERAAAAAEAEQKAEAEPRAAESLGTGLAADAWAEAQAEHAAETGAPCTCPVCVSPFVERRATMPACASAAPSAEAEAYPVKIPVAPLDPAPVVRLPVAPRLGARFLASTSLAAAPAYPSAAPSCILRIVR